MKRGIKIGVVTGAVLLLSGVALAWVLVSRGFSARETPSFVEAFVARRVRHMGVPRGAQNEKNPIPPSPEALSAAMAHFADHCAFCHANDGSGNTSIGKGLYPKPPDMRAAETQNLSDGELYFIIENGIRLTAMPAFGQGTHSNEESWKLVQFIRHLPSIVDEELARMKEMNPKTRDELKREEEIQRFLRGETENPPGEKSHDHQ